MENQEQHIADYLDNRLTGQEKATFEALLATNAALNEEVQTLKSFWETLPSPISEEPPATMDAYFAKVLANEKALSQPEKGLITNLISLGKTKRLWPNLAKYAAMLGGLVFTFYLGRKSADNQAITIQKPVYITKYIAQPKGSTPALLPIESKPVLAQNSNQNLPVQQLSPVLSEIGALRKEMQETKELMMFSMLKRESASDRIQALNYSYEFKKPDEKVLSALIYTLDHDTNINVRMAAADAIARFGNEEYVRGALVNSLIKQQDPSLQIVVIDLLINLKERRAISALQTIVSNEDSSEFVKKKAEEGMKILSI